MRRASLAFVLVLGAALGADDAANKGLDKLQGAYVVVEMMEGGAKVPDVEREALRVQWKGDQLSVRSRKPGTVEEGELVAAFQVNLRTDIKAVETKGKEKKETPPALDFLLTMGEDKGKKMVGIYKIESDTITLCFDEEGRDRPAQFASPLNSNLTLVVLKRK